MALAIANVTEVGGGNMYPTMMSESQVLSYLGNPTTWPITDRTTGNDPYDYIEFTRPSDNFVVRVYVEG